MKIDFILRRVRRIATHCDALRRIATHCDALRRVPMFCDTLRRSATHCDALRRGGGCRISCHRVDLKCVFGYIGSVHAEQVHRNLDRNRADSPGSWTETGQIRRAPGRADIHDVLCGVWMWGGGCKYRESEMTVN